MTAGGNTDMTVNLGNLSLVVGADATIESVNHYLEEHGVTCAAVPATGGKRTIGELVATATGAERDHIRHALLGADVTVIDGQTPARFGAETMKDVAGYDTKRLYIRHTAPSVPWLPSSSRSASRSDPQSITHMTLGRHRWP